MAASPNTATSPRITGVLPLAHVVDVERSVRFYAKLGFTVGGKVERDGVLNWAELKLDGVPQLMLARSGRAMNPGAQEVLFYVYAVNVAEFREQLMAAGIECGEMQFPFYSPRGEFRVIDPDGWSLFIAHAG